MSADSYNQVKHLLAIDCAIFGYEEGEVKLLLFQRGIEPAKGEWSLPGGWVNGSESVEAAAQRVLLKITGLSNIFLEQVHVFSDPVRDPGGRVVSVLFYALIIIQNHDKELVRNHGAHWFPIEKVPPLIFDHNNMVKMALEKLRAKASYELIGEQLLPEEFTLLQLRQLYDAIFQRKFDPANFRKKVLSLNALRRLKAKNTTESKRGAYYYKFKETSAKPGERIVKL